MKRIVIVGIGGHAKVVTDCINTQGEYEICGYYITDTKENKQIKTFLGQKIFTTLDNFSVADTYFIVAIGDNFTREAVTLKIKQQYQTLKLATVIHPSAIISPNVTIKPGSMILPKVVINSGSSISEGVILNTGAIVEHDCTVQDYSSLAPQAVIGGNCCIERRSAINIGATIIHGISIGQDTVIGAGALVTQNISNGVVAYGCPAKIIRSREYDEPYY